MALTSKRPESVVDKSPAKVLKPRPVTKPEPPAAILPCSGTPIDWVVARIGVLLEESERIKEAVIFTSDDRQIQIGRISALRELRSDIRRKFRPS